MVLSAAGLDDNRRNGGGRERDLHLALAIASCRLFLWQTSPCGRRRSAIGAWGRSWLGELRGGPAEGKGASNARRRQGRNIWRMADRRAVIAKRVAGQYAQAQENECRPALHPSSQPQRARARKRCWLCIAQSNPPPQPAPFPSPKFSPHKSSRIEFEAGLRSVEARPAIDREGRQPIR